MERDQLRARWGRRLDELGVVCAPGDRPDDGKEDPAIHHFREFLERWVLDGLLAWDLPCPLNPEFLGVSQLDARTRFFGGVHLFVPWYLLKDQQFQLREIARLHGPNVDQRHLRPWFEAATSSCGAPRTGASTGVLWLKPTSGRFTSPRTAPVRLS